MEPPFHASNIATLREAFPSVEAPVIDDILWSAKGDVNQAFEMLLEINDTANVTHVAPPTLPPRGTFLSPTNSSLPSASPRITTPPTSHNTFPRESSHPRQLTVREELAQWRQDLQKESSNRQQLNAARSSTLSPNLYNVFRLKSDKDYSRSNISDNHQPSHRSQSQSSFHRSSFPGTTTGNSSYNVNYSAASTPNLNGQIHSRSNSIPEAQNTPFPLTSQSTNPFNMPVRRQASYTTNSTNPFITNSNIQQNRHQPRRSYSREHAENDMPSSNPFEEPELPPPAYDEIQKDRIISLAPH